MTKAFSLLNEIENEDGQPSHLKKRKIISLLKKKFDFENSHLRPPNIKDKGILELIKAAKILKNQKKKIWIIYSRLSGSPK